MSNEDNHVKVDTKYYLYIVSAILTKENDKIKIDVKYINRLNTEICTKTKVERILSKFEVDFEEQEIDIKENQRVLESEWLSLYTRAIEEGYRLLAFKSLSDLSDDEIKKRINNLSNEDIQKSICP